MHSGWGWGVASVLVLISLIVWGGRGKQWALFSFLAGLGGVVVGFLIGEMALFGWLFGFSLGVVLVRTIASLDGRDRFTWLWLLASVLLNAVGGCLLLRNEWAAMGEYACQASLVTALAALAARAAARSYYWSAPAVETDTGPNLLLDREIKALTGLPHPAAEPGAEFESIARKLERSLGKDSWHSILVHWIPDLAWKDAVASLREVRRVESMVPEMGDWDDERLGQALARVPCLRECGIDPKLLGSSARLLVARSGDVLIRQGVTDDALFVIVKGRVAIEKEESGIRVTRLAVLEEGTYVGEISFMTGQPRTATVRAVDSLVAIVLRRSDVDANWPEAAEHIHRAADNRSWSRQIRGFPVFNEMEESLFLRTVLQGETHELASGESLPEHISAEHPVIAVIDGEVAAGEAHVGSGGLHGIDSLWVREPSAVGIKAVTASRLVTIPRALMQEAFDEIILDAAQTA